MEHFLVIWSVIILLILLMVHYTDFYLYHWNNLCIFGFSKATTLDRLYGPAWLAFGHSFAAEGEHDQAMAAYFTASQLMKG